jgi:hypothetical protein
MFSPWGEHALDNTHETWNTYCINPEYCQHLMRNYMPATILACEL